MLVREEKQAALDAHDAPGGPEALPRVREHPHLPLGQWVREPPVDDVGGHWSERAREEVGGEAAHRCWQASKPSAMQAARSCVTSSSKSCLSTVTQVLVSTVPSLWRIWQLRS